MYVCVYVCVCKSFSCVWLFTTPWTVACQALLSMGFSRQEYWSGLPFPSPGDLPDPGIKPGSPVLQADSLLSEPPGKHYLNKFQEFFCWECYSYWSSFKFVLRDGTQLPGSGCYGVVEPGATGVALPVSWRPSRALTFASPQQSCISACSGGTKKAQLPCLGLGMILKLNFHPRAPLCFFFFSFAWVSPLCLASSASLFYIFWSLTSLSWDVILKWPLACESFLRVWYWVPWTYDTNPGLLISEPLFFCIQLEPQPKKFQLFYIREKSDYEQG